MKYTKKIFILICIYLVVNMGGCVKLHNNTESIKNEMLNYVSQKYDLEFVAYSLDTNGVDSNYDELVCYVKGTLLKETKTTVRRYTENETVYYKDTYYGVIIFEDYCKIISELCLDGINGKVFFKLADNFFPDEFNKSYPLEKALNSGQNMNAFVYIFVEANGESNEAMKSMADGINEKMKTRFKNNSCIVLFYQQDAYKTIKLENYDSFLVSDKEHCVEIYYY